MAQEKLLLPLIGLLLLCTFTSSFATATEEAFAFKKEDLEFARELTNKTKKMTLSEIKGKWLQLQKMLGQDRQRGNSDDSLAYFADEQNWGSSFRIFVSSSMSKNLLQSYVRQARKYNATLVFNGLPEGSWRKLSQLVTEISGDEPEIAMQIDDEAFNNFGIKAVPCLVLSKEEDVFSEQPKVTFDKITGSIGIRRALEIFAEKGQLSEIATDILDQVQEKGQAR
jgi:type-F conjugative transfer system pilin assembly protein TrbC